MKELSKEERLNQRIEELERQIFEKGYTFDKEQGKRFKRTFYVLCGVFYLIDLLYILDGGMNKISIDSICSLIFTPLFVAGCIMFVSYGILFYILNGATTKIETLAKLEGELQALKSMKYLACESKKNIEEIKAELKILNTLLRDIIDEYKNLELNEDYENDAEENEILKLHLEDLKFSLKMIDKEYEYLKRKKVFDDEVEENE